MSPTAQVTCWDLFDIAASHGARRILLTGQKGLAKSRAAQDTLSKTHKSISQCTLNDDIAVQELLGHYIPKGTNFEWHDGPVMSAYRNGHGLVINEMGRASGAVRDMFLAVMDDESVSMIALANGENVKPGGNFQLIATSNSDASELDEALYDRFDTIIEITEPHPALIEHIESKCKGLGEIIRRSFVKGQTAISPRRALAFISYLEHGVENKIAAQLSFGKSFIDVMAAMKLNPVSAKAV